MTLVNGVTTLEPYILNPLLAAVPFHSIQFVKIVFIDEECIVPVPESKNLYHVVATFQVTSNYLSDVNLVKEISNTGMFSF